MTRFLLATSLVTAIAAENALTIGLSQSAVRLRVAVTESDSLRPVRGLTASDFDVVVDGRPAPISTISSPPITLVIAAGFDLSARANDRVLEPPRDFTHEVDADLLSRLAPDDRFAFGVFGDTISFSGFLPSDRRARVAAVQAGFKSGSIGRNGPSRIWDAVDSVVATLADQPGRRAILLVTDGRATGNRIGLDELIHRAQATDVAIAVVANGAGFMAPPHPEALLTPYSALIKLASETGGFRVGDPGDSYKRQRQPTEFFAALVNALRSSYVLELAAVPTTGTHHVDVRVKPGTEAHVRSAY